MQEISRARARKLIRSFLGIDAYSIGIHQTLTFDSQIFDETHAKKALNKLLANLHKRFEMGSLYFVERQGSDSVHFHILFFFFGELPFSRSGMKQEFGQIARRAWASAQGVEDVEPKANRTKVYDRFSLEYFLDLLLPLKTGTRTKRRKVLDWNFRNKKLFFKHRRKVHIDEERQAFASYFPLARKPKSPAPDLLVPIFARAELTKLKSKVESWEETTGTTPSWEDFKRRETGRTDKVSDFDFIQFMNGRAYWQQKSELKRDYDKDVL